MRQTQVTKTPSMRTAREMAYQEAAEQDYKTERALVKAHRSIRHARSLVKAAEQFLNESK